jgi:hypothetical protein
MAKKTTAHLHKYERITLGKNYVVFRCILPQCSHYVRKELAKGKACLCNRCNNAMVLDTQAMSYQKPHCKSCTEHRDSSIDKLKELFK